MRRLRAFLSARGQGLPHRGGMAEIHRWLKASTFGMGALFLVSCAQGGDVIGKLVVGYQGWLSAPGDGSTYNGWKHNNLECWSGYHFSGW